MHVLSHTFGTESNCTIPMKHNFSLLVFLPPPPRGEKVHWSSSLVYHTRDSVFLLFHVGKKLDNVRLMALPDRCRMMEAGEYDNPTTI